MTRVPKMNGEHLVRSVLDPQELKPGELETVFSQPFAKYFEAIKHIPNTGKCRFLASYKGEVPITSFSYSADKSTYVTSIEAHYVDYAWDEVCFHTRNPIIRGLAWIILCFVWYLCRLSEVGAVDVCYINNFLRSTNQYRDEQELSQNYKLLTSELAARYHKHVCVFRTLDRIATPNLLKALQHDHNCVFVFSRIVNHLDVESSEVFYHGQSPKDMRVVEKHLGATRQEMKDVQDGKSPFQPLMDRCREERTDSSHFMRLCTKDDSIETFQRIQKLYEDLYIRKYSTHNPMYSAEFFREVVDIWTLAILVRRRDGEIEGFAAFAECGNSSCCPALGYEMESSTPAYIILMFWTMLEAKSRKKLLNMSGGASHFKQKRGAVPVLEVSGVWIAPNTSWRRRIFWYFMAGVTSYIARPLLRRRGTY